MDCILTLTLWNQIDELVQIVVLYSPRSLLVFVGHFQVHGDANVHVLPYTREPL